MAGRCRPEPSIRVLVDEALEDGQEDDLQIQPQRPVLQIFQIVLDAHFHLFQRFGLAPPTADLRPAGNAGLDLVAQHVAADQLAVLLVVRHRMRPRPDHRHRALQHIEELRQLIERGLAQKGAERRDAGIVLLRLDDLVAVVADRHAAEFPDLHHRPVKAVTPLLEQCRPRRRELDPQRDDGHRNGDDGQDQAGDNNIFQALDPAIDTIERRFVQAEHRDTVQAGEAPVQQVEDEEIRHQIDRSRGVAERIDQLDDTVFRLHRQRDVDVIHLAGTGQLDQFIETPDPLNIVRRMVAVPLGQPVIEITDELHAHPRRRLNLVDHLLAQLGLAGNGQRAGVLPAGSHEVEHHTHGNPRHGQQHRGQHEPDQHRRPGIVGRGLGQESQENQRHGRHQPGGQGQADGGLNGHHPPRAINLPRPADAHEQHHRPGRRMGVQTIQPEIVRYLQCNIK